jgi:hypothetical protein
VHLFEKAVVPGVVEAEHKLLHQPML